MIGTKGQFAIELLGPNGEVKQAGLHDNLITNDGLDHLAATFGLGCNPSEQPDSMCWVAIGTDSTTESPADTALGTEIARQVIEEAVPGGIGNFSFITTFPAGTGTGAIVEAGILNAETDGTLFDRATFAAYNKGADDVLRVSFSITFVSV
jgi:hypothetical protein